MACACVESAWRRRRLWYRSGVWGARSFSIWAPIHAAAAPPHTCRLVNEAPHEWCVPSVVPPALADAAAAAALDEAVALLVPGLRPAAGRVLRAMRPGALAALEGAGSARDALAAADRVAAALPTLLAAAAHVAGGSAGGGAREAAAHAAAGWAAALEEALPALGHGGPSGDRRLAEVAVRGLAAAAATFAATAEEGGDVERVDALGEAVVRLLSAGTGGDGAAVAGQDGAAASAARDAAYASLLALLAGDAGGGAGVGDALQSGALLLVLAPAVAEHLATSGLAAPGTRRAAAGALLDALRCGGAAAACATLPWAAWADCHRGDPDALALADCLDAWAVQEPHWEAGGAPGAAWSGRLQALVRGLFSRGVAARGGAARRLLAVVAPELAGEAAGGAGHEAAGAARQGDALLSRPVPMGMPCAALGAAALCLPPAQPFTASSSPSPPPNAADPFRGLLDAGGPDPVLDASPALAADFTASDAAALLDVVHNRWQGWRSGRRASAVTPRHAR
jgi:hypothetical protein